MLFTRCPDCGTTFRVTDEALTKANGQVRCGRCTRVFNAYDERRDAPTETAPPPAPGTSHDVASSRAVTSSTSPPSQSRVAPPPGHTPPLAERGPASTRTAASADKTAPSSRESPPALSPVAALHEVHVERESPRAVVGAAPPAASLERAARGAVAAALPGADDGTAVAYDNGDFGAITVADVVAEAALSATASEDPDSEVSADAGEIISPSQIERVLQTDDLSVWLLEQEQQSRPFNGWGVATVVAVIALVLQNVHHYRADLVNTALIGPVVKNAYSMFGVTVTPRWDIRQYEILDWVATAERNMRGQGSLKITAHIKNLGPQYQPYPSLNLELKDRWEAAVGSRVFAPREYLTAPPRNLMAPGETARAEIEVVDPGTDAYGFELDVCIEVETHGLSCGSDKVFL